MAGVAVTNPLEDFLKYAGTERVRAHTRKIDDKVVPVKEHTRAGEDAVKDMDVLRQRQRAEFEMWRKWKEGGMQPSDLSPLVKSFRGLVRKKASVYSRNTRLPPDAVELNFQLELVNGLRSYDPAKGELGTYLYRYLDKGKRWVSENQNIGRIPENRIYKIGQFHTTIDDLKDKLGKDPTNKDIAKALGWSEKEVVRMQDELRGDLLTQGFLEDPYSFIPSRTEEVLRLFKYELEGDQRTLYEYLTGYGKPQITSTGELAKKMKLRDYQISRLKSQIEQRLKLYLDDRK